MTIVTWKLIWYNIEKKWWSSTTAFTKDELPKYTYYSSAPESPFCPTCTHNRSHTVDLKSRSELMLSDCQVILKPPFCNEEAFLLMWQNLTSIKMRLVHQKISYTFTLYVISIRMAFLHLESKQLSSEDATSKDFFCQVTFKLIWAVIWINLKHSS